jgi:hypothetical protein
MSRNFLMHEIARTPEAEQRISHSLYLLKESVLRLTRIATAGRESTAESVNRIERIRRRSRQSDSRG